MRFIYRVRMTSPLSMHPLHLCDKLRQEFGDQPDFGGFIPRTPSDGSVQPEHFVLESNIDISRAFDPEWLARRGYEVANVYEVM